MEWCKNNHASGGAYKVERWQPGQEVGILEHERLRIHEREQRRGRVRRTPGRDETEYPRPDQSPARLPSDTAVTTVSSVEPSISQSFRPDTGS